MSARRAALPLDPDVWKALQSRADAELPHAGYRDRIVRNAVGSLIRSTSTVPSYTWSVGAAIEIFIGYGGISNESATVDLIETAKHAANKFRRSADELASAGRTLDIVNLDILSESRGGAR